MISLGSRMHSYFPFAALGGKVLSVAPTSPRTRGSAGA
jgi:hypothetical protein